MNRKLTITVSEAVYEGLHRTIGRRRTSQFVAAQGRSGPPQDRIGGPPAATGSVAPFLEREKLARPHVVPQEIEASYRDMAADQTREQEALEWSEGLIAGSSLTPAQGRSGPP